MSDVAEKTAEIVADNVEDAIDGVVDVVEVVRNNPIALAAVGFVGLAAGVAGGYFLASKILTKQFEDRMTEEIAQAKEFYAGVYKTGEDGEVLSPKDALIARHGNEAFVEAVDAVREYQGREPELPPETPYDRAQDDAQIERIEKRAFAERTPEGVEVVEETVMETRNVFTDPTFDLEEEVKHRTPERPYIITHDEFYEGERNYDTVQLTYFKEDDTLVGEGSTDPIKNIDQLIGDEHLVRFGSGSKDPNVLFIRNEQTETDYEIYQSGKSYVDEVLGMNLPDERGELKHSNQRAARKNFRREE